MVIKAIAALCKRAKRIELYAPGNTGCQWIGDGHCLFPLIGMPALDDETVFAVLDIPEDKRPGYLVSYKQLPEAYSVADDDPTERLVQPSALGVVFKEEPLMPARTSLGLWFFNPDYLKPLRDLDGYELYERHTESGLPYLAVKTGFLLRAVILPKLPNPEKLLEELEHLHAELITTLSYLDQLRAEEADAALFKEGGA